MGAMNSIKRRFELGAAIAAGVLLGGMAAAAAADATDAAGRAITAQGILSHIKVLSSDEYEGRLPGTRGEELSVKYITDQFKSLGLAPGNPDGSYVQAVALGAITSKPIGAIVANGHSVALDFPKNAVAGTRRFVPSVSVKDSDIVFVGYGVVAPEYGWDDYKGIDVHGKTLLMLVNDPPVVDPHDPSKLDDTKFKGRAMTYYGRWTYKYEIAAEKGAAAAIIVHQTIPAAYGWEVVQNGWTGEKFNIAADNKHMDRAAVEAWITLEKAKELCKTAGQDFDALFKAAARPDFKPVAFKAKANFELTNTLREVTSHNVLALLPGSDPKRRDEFVVYTAHWDHFGRTAGPAGVQIFHGAADNASGVAGVLEIAKAYTRLAKPPARSTLFLAVTGEEQGLLGSKWYATHPLYPLDHTVADINLDVLNTWGRTRDVTIPGYGQSALEDTLTQIAAAHGRTVRPDQEPEKGQYFRSDHFEFARVGVPALSVDGGYDFIGKPQGWGLAKHDDYTAHDYHKPSDVVKPDWDLAGAADDLRLVLELGYSVGQSDAYPQWKSDSEFKARRDAMLRSLRCGKRCQ